MDDWIVQYGEEPCISKPQLTKNTATKDKNTQAEYNSFQIAALHFCPAHCNGHI
jgi:hypothetical protein